MCEASKAPVPETMEGLRRQNSAYRALCASMEQTQARQTELGRKYQEAVTTLDSEREANATLTEEVATLSAQVEELREALAPFVEGAAHTMVFLRSREKMHPAGQDLYSEDVERARTLLAKHKETGA